MKGRFYFIRINNIIKIIYLWAKYNWMPWKSYPLKMTLLQTLISRKLLTHLQNKRLVKKKKIITIVKIL